MIIVTNSNHDMPCIQIEYPSPETAHFIKSAVLCQWTNKIEYQLARRAGAFLQSFSNDYILVEFWRDDYQAFVDWLNENLEETI